MQIKPFLFKARLTISIAIGKIKIQIVHNIIIKFPPNPKFIRDIFTPKKVVTTES